tara:strand:+ start:37 stop:297 length:261 start_codon:yes stop_codon:yes gene_type:complete
MMSKYKYGFEEWSQDTRRFTVECDIKLSKDEVDFAISEIDVDYEDYETTHKIPLGDGTIVHITYHGSEWGDANSEITYGEEDLEDE